MQRIEITVEENGPWSQSEVRKRKWQLPGYWRISTDFSLKDKTFWEPAHFHLTSTNPPRGWKVMFLKHLENPVLSRHLSLQNSMWPELKEAIWVYQGLTDTGRGSYLTLALLCHLVSPNGGKRAEKQTWWCTLAIPAFDKWRDFRDKSPAGDQDSISSLSPGHLTQHEGFCNTNKYKITVKLNLGSLWGKPKTQTHRHTHTPQIKIRTLEDTQALII